MRTLGGVLCWGAGGLEFLFYLGFLYAWQGFNGLVIGVVVVPLAALFPFIALIVTGFSMGTVIAFGLWLTSIVGMFMMNAGKSETARSS